MLPEHGLEEIVSAHARLEKRIKCSKTASILDSLLQTFEEAEAQLTSGSTPRAEVVAKLRQATESHGKALTDEQKETYSAQSKFGKAIGKRFKADITAADNPAAFENQETAIDRAIILHYVRTGEFDLAKQFMAESCTTVDPNVIALFLEMYQILLTLDEGDLSRATAWCTANRLALHERGSTLEFELHRTHFIRLFLSRDIATCIAYAQANFPPFADRHLEEIQQMMAAFAYSHDITKSPYVLLFAQHHHAAQYLQGLKTAFIAQFTALLGMSPVSPLLTTTLVGSIALPTLLKLSSLKLAGSSGYGAVDIPLPSKFRYHSVFVCPVTKEVGGDAWMLACGHVIGGEGLENLAKGGRIKCPYCPANSEVADAIKLIL